MTMKLPRCLPAMPISIAIAGKGPGRTACAQLRRQWRRQASSSGVYFWLWSMLPLFADGTSISQTKSKQVEQWVSAVTKVNHSSIEKYFRHSECCDGLLLSCSSPFLRPGLSSDPASRGSIECWLGSVVTLNQRDLGDARANFPCLTLLKRQKGDTPRRGEFRTAMMQ